MIQPKPLITTIVCLAMIPVGWCGTVYAQCPATAEASAPASAAATQPAQADEKMDDAQKEATVEGYIKKSSVTEGRIEIEGQSIPYRATAAEMPMMGDDGKLKAHVFFIAYERLVDKPAPSGEDAAKANSEKAETLARENPAQRPVTFVFNGGPGAAAVFLHMGTAGPQRLELKDDGTMPAPPYRSVDNHYSWLDVTDLVFIDPVGTGFSRLAEGVEGKEFYGVKQDIQWNADFIRLYTTLYERWSCPKFLAGESYGTTRAAGLSSYLLDRHGIALNGIMFISAVLDFQTISVDPNGNNDLPYVLFLPSLTATAWYHDRLSDELQADLSKTLDEVRRWVIEEYQPALFRGAMLGQAEQERIAARLARYTGLSEEIVRLHNLRISPWFFMQKLLQDKKLIVGRFDSRITGYNTRPNEMGPPYDPSGAPYFGIYSATFNDYVRRVLGFNSTQPYEVLSSRVWPWEWDQGGRQGYTNVADDLREAMVLNPHLKVLFASGYFDLATPFPATDYTIEHLNLDPAARKNIIHTLYEGGHMMYHNYPALVKLKEDVAAFIRTATPQEAR